MINLFNKRNKQNLQKEPVTNPKPNSKNDLISSDPILLNEPVKGNIYCSDQVIIEGSGKVTGNIHSKACLINGQVKGNILCSETIEVKNTAIIEGNVKAGSIEIEAGSVVNGFISIDKKIKLPFISKKAEDNVPAAALERSEASLPSGTPVVSDKSLHVNEPAFIGEKNSSTIKSPQPPQPASPPSPPLVEKKEEPKPELPKPQKTSPPKQSEENGSWW